MKAHPIFLPLAAIALALACLSGCNPKMSPQYLAAATSGDLHERLVGIIIRYGHKPELSTEHRDGKDIDSIRIPVSLDSLKRQHPSLEKMLVSIAATCSQPEYAHAMILIELKTADQPDLMFMRRTLEKALADNPNILITEDVGLPSFVMITIRHAPMPKQDA